MDAQNSSWEQLMASISEADLVLQDTLSTIDVAQILAELNEEKNENQVSHYNFK